MVNRSMTDVAFELMKKKRKAISFRKLWEEVSQVMGFNEAQAENKIATFYANLTLDTRFALVEDLKWDLRSRRTFNEIHKDLSDLLDDNDDIFEDEVEGEADDAAEESVEEPTDAFHETPEEDEY